MRTPSPWESGHSSRQSKFCFGRITKVYPETRHVELKTFGLGAETDQHISRAQWLSPDSHPDGDESGVIPRVNSYCLVFFINGEAFVWGFLKPLTKEGSAANPNTDNEDLQEGDRLLSTVAGNKIILRSSGEIQIESNENCRTIYYAEEDIVNTVCRNYELRLNGGTVDWIIPDKKKGHTIYQAEYRQNIDRKKIVVESKGYIDGGEYVTRYEVGVGTDNGDISEQVYTKETKKDGTTRTFIRKPGASVGYEQVIKPSGETVVNIADKSKTTILETGETTVNIADKHKLNIKPDGKTSLNVNDKCMIDIEASGNVKVDVGGKSTITITPDGTVTIKAETNATVEAKKINLKGEKVDVGSAAAHPIPLGDLFLQQLNKLIALYNSHTHQVPQAIAGILPSLPPQTPSEIIVDKVVLSQTVKVQP